MNHVNVADPNFNIGDFNSQAGTGSIDFMANITHMLMWNKSGIVTNAAYRINTSNKQDYKFGNRTYLNQLTITRLQNRLQRLNPTLDSTIKAIPSTLITVQKLQDSNGYNLNATVGVNVLHKKLVLIRWHSSQWLRICTMAKPNYNQELW